MRNYTFVAVGLAFSFLAACETYPRSSNVTLIGEIRSDIIETTSAEAEAEVISENAANLARLVSESEADAQSATDDEQKMRSYLLAAEAALFLGTPLVQEAPEGWDQSASARARSAAAEAARICANNTEVMTIAAGECALATLYEDVAALTTIWSEVSEAVLIENAFDVDWGSLAGQARLYEGQVESVTSESLARQMGDQADQVGALRSTRMRPLVCNSQLDVVELRSLNACDQPAGEAPSACSSADFFDILASGTNAIEQARGAACDAEADSANCRLWTAERGQREFTDAAHEAVGASGPLIGVEADYDSVSAACGALRNQALGSFE